MHSKSSDSLHISSQHMTHWQCQAHFIPTIVRRWRSNLSPRINPRTEVGCYVHGTQHECYSHTYAQPHVCLCQLNLSYSCINPQHRCLTHWTGPHLSVCNLLLLSQSILFPYLLPGRHIVRSLQEMAMHRRLWVGGNRCCICCNPNVHASASNTMQ